MDNPYREAYNRLYKHFGPQNWWPAQTPFEVMVGAVLTQNTSWRNVVKAIENLRDAGLLEYTELSLCPVEQIAALIRPSGYYNLKARRLKNLLKMIADEYGGDLEVFVADQVDSLRENLLRVKGIGPETADSILLYACGQPVFVVDAYTYRVFSRHHLVPEEIGYDELQDIFMSRLPTDAALFNEYHALIVRVAVTFCKKSKPLCDSCPLNGLHW